MKEKNQGITLIALIITIIIMLILVAVSISLALNSGLFEKAGASVTKNGNLWIIKPAGGNTAVIEVLAEVDGRMVSMGKQEYRVKQLPRPDAYFMLGGEAKGESGKITRADRINSNQLTMPRI